MWPKLVAFLLLGYLSMGRAFAYWGVPQAQIFIGEVVLAAFIIWRPAAVLGRWLGALRWGTLLAEVAWAFYFLLAYGLFEVLRGVGTGYPALTALENLAFNYYPLYLFLGLWVGTRSPNFIHRFIPLLAWWNGVYGAVWILLLRRYEFSVPGGFLTFFGQPGGSVVALLGLLIFVPNWRRSWPLLLLNTFVLLGTEVRGEWLGFLVGLCAWGAVTLRFGRLLNILGSGLALLWIAYLVDFQMPGARGGELSTRGVIGRALAPINQELAAQYTDTAESAAGTFSWRTEWWAAIWTSVHANPITTLVGHGYGFPLASLAPFVGDQTTRTPHNVFYYALGYSGWIGVGVFFVFQLALVRLLWRAYRLTGQPFGLVYWASVTAAAFFGNVFEAPFGAVPFYVLTGISIAPALVAEQDRWLRAAASADRRPMRPRPRPERWVTPAGTGAATRRPIRRHTRSSPG